MSRSYKQVACWKDPNTKKTKRYANKKVRRTHFHIPSGNAYKKIFCSYIICDYKFFKTFQSYKIEYKQYNRGKILSHKEIYKKWYKNYKMK